MTVGFCLGVLLHLILTSKTRDYYWYKGELYRLEEKGQIQNHLGNGLSAVFYRSMKDGKLYARPAEGFYRLFKPSKSKG